MSSPHTSKEDVALALKMAVEAHEGQTDKLGVPYIFHVINVWQAICRIEGLENKADYETVALLHDIVEDTDVTLNEIDARFGSGIAQAVAAMTKQKNERYADYLVRVKADPVARIVKLADSQDNYRRVPLLSDSETKARLLAKYENVFSVLKEDSQ